jgi:hypothetical protein
MSVVLAMIFIISTSGILIYKTHCLCTGSEQVGIYVKPDTCDEDFHVHHTHDAEGHENETCENLCHECSPTCNDCGCDSPEIRFFKLTNDATQDEASYERVTNLSIRDIVVVATICFTEPDLASVPEKPFADCPPKTTSSKKFLIQVNQLKIPHIA